MIGAADNSTSHGEIRVGATTAAATSALMGAIHAVTRNSPVSRSRALPSTSAIAMLNRTEPTIVASAVAGTIATSSATLDSGQRPTANRTT